MNYIVAVSGGVDSVVLLDLMSRTNHHIVVAHVDHGIRNDSAADARFVEALARQYGVPFVTIRYELGASASEDEARTARYEFLKSQSEKYHATLMTAHHGGDLIETIAINLTRGTGWRGLAVMGEGAITRPLLQMTKQQLLDYAVRHRLEWVEDETNSSSAYLRNRLRRKVNRLVDSNIRTKLFHLRSSQLLLRSSIDREIARHLVHAHSRHFLGQIDQPVAEELLSAYVAAETGVSLTRPQRSRAVLAIKTAKAGSTHQIAHGIELRFTSRNLYIKVV